MVNGHNRTVKPYDNEAIGCKPLRPDILSAAQAVLDREGLNGLALAAVARELGVSCPSLYKHVASLEDLKRRLRLAATASLSEALRESILGRAGDDAVRAIVDRYRSWAHTFPARYAAITQLPVAGTDDEFLRAAEPVTGAFRAVLRAYGLDASATESSHLALWVTLHGFVSLDLAGVLQGPRAEHTLDHLIREFLADLRRLGSLGESHEVASG